MPPTLDSMLAAVRERVASLEAENAAVREENYLLRRKIAAQAEEFAKLNEQIKQAKARKQTGGAA